MLQSHVPVVDPMPNIQPLFILDNIEAEQPIEWLEAGAPADPERMLGVLIIGRIG